MLQNNPEMHQIYIYLFIFTFFPQDLNLLSIFEINGSAIVPILCY